MEYEGTMTPTGRQDMQGTLGTLCGRGPLPQVREVCCNNLVCVWVVEYWPLMLV